MTTLRVASWNIRKCVGLDRRRDPDRVMRGIAGLEADVVALQEADRRMGARPSALPADAIETVTGLSPVDAGGGARSIGWHGNAVLLGRGLVAQDVTGIHLPGLEPRGALIVETTGTREVRLVATHLGLTRRARRMQLREIARHLGRRRAMPTVILGDFNEWNPGRGMEPIEDDFTVHMPGLSFHAARPVAALDRIATCKDLTLRAAGVLKTVDTRRASDHLPVWADISETG